MRKIYVDPELLTEELLQAETISTDEEDGIYDDFNFDKLLSNNE